MRKLVIGSLAIVSVLVLSGCMGKNDKMTQQDKMEKETIEQKEAMMKQEAMEKNDTMMKKDDSMMDSDKMMKDDSAMMKKDDAMVQDDAMMKKDTMVVAGSYTTYSASAVTAALAAKKNVVLFFHATWCPTCKAADTSFKKETPPANTVVFKVDYDTNKDLRSKYGVTYQHTFVSLNADETLKKKSSGAKSFAELAELN